MPLTLPLFPLNTVVFPGSQLPLRIFEQRYLDMVKQAIADNTPFGICAPAWGTPVGAPPLRGDPSAAIREGAETGAPTAPYSIGTRVRVTDWDMPQAGILHIDTQAEERFVVPSTRRLSMPLGDRLRRLPAVPLAVKNSFCVAMKSRCLASSAG